MKDLLLSAPARTDILFGIAVLILRFLIYQIAGDGIVPLLFNFLLWLVAWGAIIIGMAKLGKRQDWQGRLRERAREDALLAAAVSKSARVYIVSGIALHLLAFLVAVGMAAVGLRDNFAVEALRYLMGLVAWAAIAIGIVRIGNRKDWWSGLSERSEPVRSIDMAKLRRPGSPLVSFAIGIALILLGFAIRSVAFLEFLYDTKFLFELVVEVDQGLWSVYEPLYSALGTNLHIISPTLGVLGWLGILSGVALVVIAAIQLRGTKETQNRSD